MSPEPESRRAALWTAAVLAVSLPAVAILCATLWRAPYPISDSIGHFEDVQRRPVTSFLVPSTSYYRPLFYVALSGVWNNAPSIADALTAIKLFHIVPITLLVLLLVRHVRPQNAIDAAAATFAVAVLVGSPGFRDNLEVPLSYTIVGMPAALGVWMLLEPARTRWGRSFWRGLAIVGLTLFAIGFKEQGLVLVPLVVAAWWLRAPGAGRWTAIAVTAVAIAYVLFRLGYHDPRLPLFEQDVGLGFSRMSASDAEERFRDFPLSIYAYSGASTIANVLFSEPTEGVYRIVQGLSDGPLQPWHVVHLASSLALTALIGWWGIASLRRHRGGEWSFDERLFLSLLVVLAATGALSFNYSRDRLGGMAVPFYALAAFHAVRAAAQRAQGAAATAAAAAALALLLLGTAWQLRVLHTIENTRQRAVNTEREWSTRYHRRLMEFTDRPVYTHILEEMLPQGTSPAAVRHTRYPRWMTRTLGEY